MTCGGLLSYLAKNSSIPFEFPFGKTTDTPVPSLLSFEDAVFAFFPEMAHIALEYRCFYATIDFCTPLLFSRAGKKGPSFRGSCGLRRLIRAATDWVCNFRGCWNLPYMKVNDIANGLLERDIHI